MNLKESPEEIEQSGWHVSYTLVLLLNAIYIIAFLLIMKTFN